MNLFTKQKQTQRLREITVVTRGKGWREEQTGSLRLTCTYCCTSNRKPTRTTVQHWEFCSILCSNLNRKRICKRIGICITESLCSTPETSNVANQFCSMIKLRKKENTERIGMTLKVIKSKNHHVRLKYSSCIYKGGIDNTVLV